MCALHSPDWVDSSALGLVIAAHPLTGTMRAPKVGSPSPALVFLASRGKEGMSPLTRVKGHVVHPMEPQLHLSLSP